MGRVDIHLYVCVVSCKSVCICMYIHLIFLKKAHVSSASIPLSNNTHPHTKQAARLKHALGSAHALMRHLRLLLPSMTQDEEEQEQEEEEEEEGVEGTYELSILTLRDCLQYDAAAARYGCCGLWLLVWLWIYLYMIYYVVCLLWVWVLFPKIHTVILLLLT